MFCARYFIRCFVLDSCVWVALVLLCHVVGLTLCVRVTPLGLERMFGQSYAKGGLDLGFPQSSAAVTCYDRAVSECDRAMSQFDRAVSTGRGFRGSFHVNLCRDENLVYFEYVTCEPCCGRQAFVNPIWR